MEKPAAHPPVGIDLGTTFSAVAYLDDQGRADTIRNAEGDQTTPSAVFFDRTSPIVGVEAVEAGMQEPERLAMFAKRDVGEIAYQKEIRGQSLPPEVIQACLLRKLKADAEMKLGPIKQVVITVPAFFNEPCRKATQDAGRLAGLEVLDIINEPTAAAITYGVQHGFLSEEGESRQTEKLLVYDLGGGTFDVTVMEIEGSHYRTIATAGDVYLGGLDWDRRIVDFISEAFMKEHDIDPREDELGTQELQRKAIQAKHALTQRESYSIAFSHEGNRIRTDLTRTAFESLTEDLVERTLMTTRLVLDDAKINPGELTRLVLVGGSTRMPMIQREIEETIGLKVDRSLSPDEAVCHGAAIYAGIIQKSGGKTLNSISVSNVNSHDLGVLAIDPKTNQPRRQVMIARNSKLPATKRVRFRTHADSQTNVKIEIVEGGDDQGHGSTTVGKCLVSPLPDDTPKGTNVDVQFIYGDDGRLTVAAMLPEVNCEAKSTIDRASGLTETEFDKWLQLIDSGFGDPETPPTETPSAQTPSAQTQSTPAVSVEVSKAQPAITPVGKKNPPSKVDKPTPAAPVVPAEPATPAVTEAPVFAQGPKNTEAPKITGVPEIAGAPKVSGVPDIAGLPGVTATPKVAEAPKIAGLPQRAEAPNISEAPPIFAAPEIKITKKDSRKSK